jgi:hypothetical protein
MIRNKNQIYGEPNDPNTVLASEPLVADKYVVGAGNKGIKTYDAGNKKLMITDQYGRVSCVSYDVPNKCIGTDINGDIVLREIPTGGDNMRFGSEQSPITSFTVNNSNVIHSIGTDEGCTTIALTKLVDSVNADKFTFEFETPIVLTQDTECRIAIHVSLQNALLNNLTLLNIFDEEIVLNQNNSACSKIVKLPAGQYKKITVTEEQPSLRYNNQAMTFSCLISY